jgi:hypothetical protein
MDLFQGFEWYYVVRREELYNDQSHDIKIKSILI